MLTRIFLPALGVCAGFAMVASAEQDAAVNTTDGGDDNWPGDMQGKDWKDSKGWGNWGGDEDAWWFKDAKDTCPNLGDDKSSADSAFDCINKEWDSIMNDKKDDDVWGKCGDKIWNDKRDLDDVMGDNKQDDDEWKSCACSWLLGPQANCIASACQGGEYTDFQASVSSKFSCSGTPTDAPTSATIIGAGSNPTSGPGSDALAAEDVQAMARETAAPVLAAGLVGIAALFL